MFLTLTGLLTVVEFSAELVVGASLHYLSHMLSFFVDRHCPDDCSLRWAGQNFDLNGTCFSDLTVQLLEVCGVLGRTEQKGELSKDNLLSPSPKPMQ